MSGLPVVAIAGGTGNLGSHLTKAFLLPEFRNLFSKVIVLARSESPKTEEFADAGAEIRTYSDDDIAPALDGVQVLVNA
jgi:NAD dependent epimerase/dehydratase family enzyme